MFSKKLGDKCRAREIPQERQLQLFETPDDIRWALEQHAQDAGDYHFTPENCDGVIIAGNEDAPIFVWGTRLVDRKEGVPANHLDAVYTLLAAADQDTYTHP